MTNASRNAVGILIFVFILCFLLLFAALYAYHNRTLQKIRDEKKIEDLSHSEPRAIQQDAEDQGGLFNVFNNILSRGSEEEEFIQQAQSKRQERKAVRQEHIQKRRANYKKRWVSIDPQVKLINRSGLSSRLALIHTFKLLPTLVIFLFTISFSVFFTLSPFQRESFQYHNIAIPSYTVLIIYLILIIFSEFLFIPRLFKRTELMVHQSRIANAAYERAKELKSDYDKSRDGLNYHILEEARDVIEITLDMDPDNREVRKLHDEILEQIYEHTFESREEEREVREEEENLTLFDRGRRALQDDHYFDALRYFELSIKFFGEDPNTLKYLAIAQDEVNKELGSLSRKEKKIREYIEGKERALRLFNEGDYHGAYFILSRLRNDTELMKTDPRLHRDVELRIEDVKKELQTIDFHPSEITDYEWLPSFDNIVFTDKNGFINSVSRIIPWKNQYYFVKINRYRMKDNRSLVSQTMYGKWMGNKIRLKGLLHSSEIGRDSRDYMRVPDGKELLYYIETDLHPQYLIYFNDGELLLRQLDVYERFSLTNTLRENGFDIESRSAYLARKLGIFFSVYILTLIFAGIAWRKRSIYEFPPGFKLLIVIIITPVLCYLFHRLYIDVNSIIMYTHRYVIQYIFKRGMNIAIYTGIINLIISVFATIYYLSQRSSME